MRTLLCSIVFSMIATSAFSQVVEGVDPDSVGAIEVQLRDHTSEACWVNLREAREYAEERLAIAGYDVVQDNHDYQFRVVVHGDREPAFFGRGNCWGAIRIVLGIGLLNDGLVGTFLVADYTLTVQGAEDLNDQVITAIDRLIDLL